MLFKQGESKHLRKYIFILTAPHQQHPLPNVHVLDNHAHHNHTIASSLQNIFWFHTFKMLLLPKTIVLTNLEDVSV